MTNYAKIIALCGRRFLSGAVVPVGGGAGVCRSAVQLGVMYSDGQGVPQNDAEAVRWYRLAAEQGHAEAQFSR